MPSIIQGLRGASDPWKHLKHPGEESLATIPQPPDEEAGLCLLELSVQKHGQT